MEIKHYIYKDSVLNTFSCIKQVKGASCYDILDFNCDDSRLTINIHKINRKTVEHWIKYKHNIVEIPEIEYNQYLDLYKEFINNGKYTKDNLDNTYKIHNTLKKYETN